MKLSKNLSLAEVTKSITAQRLGIDNTPKDEWIIENLKSIAEHVFQPLRNAFGCPIHVSSGYRGPELNRAIGGSKRSQHVEEEHSTWTQTYSDVVQTLRSSTTLKRIWSLISSFGNLVMKTILIGFTCLTFTMGIIAAAASRLAGMIKDKLTTK